MTVDNTHFALYSSAEVTRVDRPVYGDGIHRGESGPAWYRSSGYQQLYFVSILQKSLESTDLGTEIESIEANLAQHRIDHQDINNFRKQIEKCISDGVSVLNVLHILKKMVLIKTFVSVFYAFSCNIGGIKPLLAKPDILSEIFDKVCIY